MEPELTFRALADKTRRRTLTILSRQELSVSELVKVLDQPQSTVSRHLKTLRDAGLVSDRRHGNTALYALQSTTSTSNGADLTGRVLDWIKEQSLSPSLSARLDSVMRSRRDVSNHFFTQLGRRWDALREESFGSTFHLEALISLLPRNLTVVDVGAGTGYLLPALADQFARVIGVDPVEAMLEVARERVNTLALENVDLCKGDLSRLPIADETADVAVAMLVLHHVPSPTDALAELLRIVRDGGTVLIVEQNAHEDEGFRDRMQDNWWGFEPETLRDLLQSTGFRDTRLRMLPTSHHNAGAPDLYVATARRPQRHPGADTCKTKETRG
ncbi:MAG: ArsR family transcriptional regulator [Phycisphaerales bacterium]|nr:MAG: ArsR family transcriptional regulator [Phycisphaerales bacterium]